MVKKLTAETIQRCVQLYQQGWSSEKIGKKIGSKAQTVTKYLKEAGIEVRGPKKKLTEDDKKEMCRLYLEGWSAPKIGDKFEVAHTLVLRYLEKAGIERRTSEECHRKYAIHEDFFDTINTEEKAYFLGFLYADGCNHKDANYVSLGLEHSDREILERLAAFIYVDDPISHVKEQDRTHEGKGITSYFTINSKHICGQLEKLGCPQAKTFRLTYPEWMPEHLHCHFIRGYFDGDGGLQVNTRKGQGSTWKITSTSQFANSVKKIIEKEVDAHLCIWKAKHSNVYDAYTSGDRQIRKILNWIYQDATIWMKRKYDSYLKLQTEIAETDRLIREGTQGYQKRYLTK